MSIKTKKIVPGLAKFLKYGIFLTAFTPLIIFSQFISPFHFGKAFIFRSLIEILAVFYLVLLIKYGKNYLPSLTPLFWSITLFTAIFGLTTFTSINIYQSFWGTLERMGGWFSFLHFWGFFVIASAILRKKEDWLFFIKLSLFISLLSSFYGFLQKTQANWVIGSGGRAKIFGTIGNPALFAGYEILNIFLALMLYFRPQSSFRERYFYFSVFLIDSFAVLLTGIRGSVLAIAVGLILFGFLYSLNFASKKIRNLTLGFLILLVIVGGILYSLRNSNFVKENQYLARYSDISPTTYTVKTRTWAWQAGFDGWNDSVKSIILGWGPEMFNIPFSLHFNPKFFRGPGSETLFDRAHNQFLEVLFTMGILGFLSYLLIFIFAFKNINFLAKSQEKEEKVFRIGLIATLVAYIIHNSFIFDTTANYLLFFIVLGFINYLFITHYALPITNYGLSKEGVNNLKPKRIFLANFSGVCFLILAILSIYFFEIIPAKANYTTTRGILASWNSNHDLAFEKFKEAMSYDTFGKYEIRHRYAQYILEQATRKGVDQKMKERLLVAIENVKKNVKENPKDYLPYLYISRSYILLGKNDPKSEYNDLALENSLKALEISPTFVRTYYEIAQAYLNKKDYKKAEEWFEKAAKLNPEVSLSWWYLGITTIEGGDIEKGLKIIESSGYPYKNDEVDLFRMINVYLRLNDFKKLTELYEALVKLKPKNPQYHASLAFAYSKIGNKEKAIEHAQIAVQLDPSYAKEAEAFIKNLR